MIAERAKDDFRKQKLKEMITPDSPYKTTADILAYCKKITKNSRKWMQENPTRRIPKGEKNKFQGKMDHTTMISVLVGERNFESQHSVGTIRRRKHMSVQIEKESIPWNGTGLTSGISYVAMQVIVGSSDSQYRVVVLHYDPDNIKCKLTNRPDLSAKFSSPSNSQSFGCTVIFRHTPLNHNLLPEGFSVIGEDEFSKSQQRSLSLPAHLKLVDRSLLQSDDLLIPVLCFTFDKL